MSISEGGSAAPTDGGAEAASGYATDITRTWPVSNIWTNQQKNAYNAVLKAQEAAISKVHSGIPFGGSSRSMSDPSGILVLKYTRVKPGQAW